MSDDPKFIKALREEWQREGEAMLQGATPPSRARLIDGAHAVVIRAMLRCGFSITEVAKRCNTSRKAVRDTMRRLGLYQPPPSRPAIDWNTVPLGQETDVAIARRLGCSTTIVRTARLARGIRRASWSRRTVQP